MEENKQIDGRSTRAQGIYKLTHDLLLESAIEILNDPKLDPEKVTLAQIAKNCNLSTAVAYKHFPDKMMDVYGAVIGKVTDEMLKDMEVAALKRETLLHYLRKCYQSLQRPRLIWAKLQELRSLIDIPFFVKINGLNVNLLIP